MSAVRNRRLPISCEPCRIRKIRCPRDGTPCGSCIHRGVPVIQCQYATATRRSSHRASANGRMRVDAPLSPSASASSSSPLDTGSDSLADRVQRLEQLLRTSNGEPRSDRTQASPPTEGQRLSSAGQAGSHLRFATTQAKKHLSGVLRTHGNGYVKFVPYSSNWASGLNPLDGGTVTGEDLAIDATWPPAFSSTVDRDVLISGLPSKSDCKELVQVYLTSFASLFHVLHDPIFQSQYQSFEGDPTSVSLSWLALLYTTLATAVLALSHDSHILVDLSRKRTAFDRTADLTARYRALAMKCLEADNYLWNNNLTTVQALVVLIYSISHTHGPTWSLIGLACNIAVSIGCHVDPDAFDVDNVEKEQRRRCWAALMMLYTQQNATMGNVASSRFMFQSDARAPADVDDCDITLNTTSRTDQPSQMTYLLAKFRLYDLCTEICESVLSTPQPDVYVVPSLDARIQAEQRGWHARYMENSSSDQMPAYHYAHLNILYSYSGHLALLLHQHTMSDNRVSDGSIRWSRERSLQEAKRILAIHQEFESCPRLAPFKWYNRGLGSFHAFHAAVVVIALLRVSLSEQESVEQHELLQRSLACFQVMSELSPLCAKAHPILCRLYARAQTETTPLITPPLSTGLTNELSDEFDWDALSNQIQPQQWLTPSNMPWEQLNTLVMV